MSNACVCCVPWHWQLKRQRRQRLIGRRGGSSSSAEYAEQPESIADRRRGQQLLQIGQRERRKLTNANAVHIEHVGVRREVGRQQLEEATGS